MTTEQTDIQPSTPDKPAGTFRSGPVFGISAGLIALFVALTAIFTDSAGRIFQQAQDWIVASAGWFYLLIVFGFLVFVIYLAFSRFGRTRLGPDDAEPEFGFISWFAMLFSAGMGIGLMFYGVAEPIFHYSNPPVGEGNTVEAAREAMSLTLFHWGVHAWAIYVVVGLAVAYYSFRHNLPLTIRSTLYPFLGKRIDGRIGQMVDIFAVLGTLFGVATSLGLGVMQVNAGLAYLFGIEQSSAVQFLLIGLITAAATISVVTGLGKGIRRLSELNIILALLLLVFVFAAGPTLFLLQATLQNFGNYLGALVPRSFNLYAYQPNEWIGSWTLFYWGWWISWAPFVGMFIARVSRGRTIKEFILAVLSVPAILATLWFTAFGNTAIALDMQLGGAITDAVTDDISTAFFVFFEQLPFAGISSLVATALVMTFFVTSSDSGSLVIDMITSGGDPDPPTWTRVFWAITEGVVAAILLAVGGLAALQTAAIAAGLPFGVIMVFICFGLVRGLRVDQAVEQRRRLQGGGPAASGAGSWQQRLRHILDTPKREEAERYLTEKAQPALLKVAEEISTSAGWETEVNREGDTLFLVVSHGEVVDFRYAIHLRKVRRPSFAFPEMTFRDNEKLTHYRCEVSLLSGPQHYDVYGLSETQLISDVLGHYDMHLSLMHIETPAMRFHQERLREAEPVAD